MLCSSCGKDNAEGNWVCSGCGEPLNSPATQQPQYYEDELPRSSPTPDHKDRGSTITKIIAVAVIAGLAIFSTWYFFFRSPDTSTPKGTVEAYIKAIANDDCETIYELVPSTQVPESRDQAVDACSQFTGLLNIDFTDYKTLRETIDDDTATVDFEITVKAAGQELPIQMTMQLIKEGTKWKVETSSGA